MNPAGSLFDRLSKSFPTVHAWMSVRTVQVYTHIYSHVYTQFNTHDLPKPPKSPMSPMSPKSPKSPKDK